MRKILFFGLMLACSHVNAAQDQDVSDKACGRKPRCCPAGPTGPTGLKGSNGHRGSNGPAGDRGKYGRPGPVGDPGCRGPIGFRGATGPTGPTGSAADAAEINNMIEVTGIFEGPIGDALVGFTAPIETPANGIDIPPGGDLELVQSLPDGLFDTITLPLESSPTLYSVSFGVYLGGIIDTIDFQLVLNGTPLEYTTLGLNSDVNENPFAPSPFSRTSIIVNPAGIEGELQLRAVGLALVGGEATSGVYMTVVKLNNNAP